MPENTTKESHLQRNVARWRASRAPPPTPLPVLPKFRKLVEYIKDGKPSWVVVPGGASHDGK